MNVTVKKVTPEESIIEVNTRSGVEQILIEKTKYGHSYNDFGDWDISDQSYYDLEELVDQIIGRMDGNNSTLNVKYE